ncbi:MAG TPA: type IIL restriction-modification enzyme MmeI, partial [Candidatus Heimdallarchaeota archaeon]|nr:type IIL restriction-modification enzyme MmeI [Candidatus Heimdallarchaeota archaeon]
GANRKTLERIKETGDIFWAQSDRNWILNGAAVHVSMIGFDENSEAERELDGQSVGRIHPDLTALLDLTQARHLRENRNIAFMGATKGGSFDIPDELARHMLTARGNPNGRPNSDVIRPWVNAKDITARPRCMWIIDFGASMSVEDASGYEVPFEYIEKVVQQTRLSSRTTRSEWWLHERPRPAMRDAVDHLPRLVATPRVSKHRLFVWIHKDTLPGSATFIFAREDDYFFGVLHSKIHELWALRQGTQLEDRPRYTPTTCFDTFPFPWPPGKEPIDDPRAQAIAAAAVDLVEKRDRWLNPEGASAAELKRRTLTNLYNQRPTWLDLAHKRLDQAVLDAYAWPHDLTDDEILEHLLALNLERGSSDHGDAA